MAKTAENKTPSQIKLPVYGMSCEHCVRRVTKALEKLPGISDVQVSLSEESASFCFTPEQLDMSTVREAIEEAGYSTDTSLQAAGQTVDTPLPARGQEEITLPVYGMTCEHCVRRVTKALEKLHGIENVRVSLADSKALLAFDRSQVDMDDINNTIEEAGYSTKPIPNEEAAESLETDGKESEQPSSESAGLPVPSIPSEGVSEKSTGGPVNHTQKKAV